MTQYQQVELTKPIIIDKISIANKNDGNISDDYLVKTIDRPYAPGEIFLAVFFAALGFLVGLVMSISYILIKFSWTKDELDISAKYFPSKDYKSIKDPGYRRWLRLCRNGNIGPSK